jgi:K(+)-stimulated pyrophosphate-energized sodium pump
MIAGKAVNLAGAEAVAGLLMVGTISGVLLAMLMNNGGGAWDNAKKFIETGQYGGKKSDAHKAAVVGDTVGDPFKDTSSVALNPIIKFTTLFGLLAVELAVSLTRDQSALFTDVLAAVFLAISLFFVYRSFYGMRIERK